jgi:hypothetical protein
VTIDGSPTQGGQLTLSVGNAGRTVEGDLSAAGETIGAQASRPGYVAPDSNAVPPADRTAVRGYFTPPPETGQ